ncbi:MAG: hypothetical protein U0270_30950 [Labilithrix sp.]
MNRSPRVNLAVAAAILSVLAVACSAEWVDEDSSASESNLDGSSLVCTSAKPGRSYELFDGSKLEAKRADESFDANRARFKPFAVMADEYKRVLGVTPKSLATAAATFEDPPARWHAEAAPSAVAIDAIYRIGLEGCTAMVAASAELAAAPTAASAKTFCADLMDKAWGEAPAAALDTCADLATNKLSGEPDARKRWAHTCAAVVTSPQFLTF